MSTNSIRKFPYKADDWRVWWDDGLFMWRAQRWGGGQGIISAPRMESNNLRFVTDGKFMRFTNCEAKVGAIAFQGEQHVIVDVLRLMPRTQAVEVPVIELFPKVSPPGRS